MRTKHANGINFKFSNQELVSRARNCAIIRNMESEKEIFKYIKDGKLSLPPMTFAVSEAGAQLAKSSGADLIIKAQRNGNSYNFAAEVKRYSSDKSVMESANNARLIANNLNMNPMVIVPWLSDEQLLYLEQAGVSGLDLCGNGIVQVAPELLIIRTGQPNKYRASRLVKRVYEGTSSLVARVFLSRPSYNSVSEVLSEITTRGGQTTLPTISKALKQMEEDLVIEKSKKQIRLIQADKLLDSLAQNYEQPKTVEKIRCKLSANTGDIKEQLRLTCNRARIRLALSGTSSSTNYATMAREPLDIYYCSRLPFKELEAMGIKIETQSRFPNFEFRETDSQLVFFDMRRDSSGNYVAPPLQAYIELTKSDKRGQETAEQIRTAILEDIAEQLKGVAK